MLTLRGASSCKGAWGMKHWMKVESTQCSSRPPSSCFPTPGFSTSSQFPLPYRRLHVWWKSEAFIPNQENPFCQVLPLARPCAEDEPDRKRGNKKRTSSSICFPFRTHDTSMWTSSNLACLMTCSSLYKWLTGWSVEDSQWLPCQD